MPSDAFFTRARYAALLAGLGWVLRRYSVLHRLRVSLRVISLLSFMGYATVRMLLHRWYYDTDTRQRNKWPLKMEVIHTILRYWCWLLSVCDCTCTQLLCTLYVLILTCSLISLSRLNVSDH